MDSVKKILECLLSEDERIVDEAIIVVQFLLEKKNCTFIESQENLFAEILHPEMLNYSLIEEEENLIIDALEEIIRRQPSKYLIIRSFWALGRAYSDRVSKFIADYLRTSWKEDEEITWQALCSLQNHPIKESIDVFATIGKVDTGRNGDYIRHYVGLMKEIEDPLFLDLNI